MNQIAIMMTVPDRARADVLLKPDRLYYRFATESMLEDGDLPGLGDNFASVSSRILDTLAKREGENPLPYDEIKVSVFVDNVAKSSSGISEEALHRLIDQLVGINEVFSFVKGFA